METKEGSKVNTKRKKRRHEDQGSEPERYSVNFCFSSSFFFLFNVHLFFPITEKMERRRRIQRLELTTSRRVENGTIEIPHAKEKIVIKMKR